jgi:signal transduction histidine kinase/CheY-like chemotaxis protein
MFRMFGLPVGEPSQITSDVFLSRVHPEDRVTLLTRMEEATNAKRSFALEFRTIPFDGQPRFIRVFGEVRCDAHGEPVEIFGINQDITEERRIQQVLADAKEEAEAANRAKSAFLANMSHEFRTPLNAILGFSRLLKASQQATPAQLEHLELINRSGEHLLTLINNVLEISKIEAGRAQLEEASFDLHQLIGVLQSLIQVQALEKGLSFSVELAPELPCTVTADAGKLRQVLLNLLGNAVKYTPHGGVILRASVLAWEPPERARLRFEVEDSGVGIRPEDCSRLFIPFVQLANRPSTESGTGLGLVISKQYVELMGGHIEVRSQPDQGSIFSIEVPVKLAPREAVAIAPIAGRVIGLAPGQPHYRLLIVEDQPENRLLLREILEPLELELREAANGQEAVTMCQQWHPDLVWMDIRMPVMDGVEATRRIKGRSTNAIPKIVALTAHALEEERREILAAGCDDFVRKPYREEEIFSALTRQLGMQFLYAAEPGATANETLVLSAEQLRPLPPAWLEELRQTAELLDGPRCLAVIGWIGQRDPPVGTRLRHMVENFQYKPLLTLLDQVTKRGDP